MNENNYAEYKKNLSKGNRKRGNLRRGKILLVIGVCFLLYLLFILPFHAGNADEIRGDELKAGNAYGRVRVYYIDHLQILRAKTDTDGDRIYCIAKFLDREQNEWIVSFTPGNDELLAKRIRLSASFEDELTLTVSGYFQLGYLEDLPFEADSFYSVYAGKYADADGSNLLNLNADYLCGKADNYTLEPLRHPGIPLGSLIVGLVGVLYGSFLLIRNRDRETV